jgi:thiamine biosynthesis lipoprotein
MFALMLTSLLAPPERFEFTEPHMGTRFRVVMYAPDEATASKAVKAAFARVKQLDDIMSDYKPASELMQLCKKAGGPPVHVSDELFYVLEKAQELSKRTDGAFDVSVGPVVRLWRIARKAQRLPDADELKAALPLVGYKNIVLDPKTKSVRLLKEGMRLDLGGIGKGYAADEAVKVLREQGLTRVLVAAGGDIVVGDAPPGEKGWRVGIMPLNDPQKKPTRFLTLDNSAVSTSGDAEQYVEIEGKRYSHIVDPKTGIGILGPFSVTVTARRGIDSDRLTKVAVVMGPEKGMPILDAMEGVAALMIRKVDGKEEVIRSKRFKEND